MSKKGIALKTFIIVILVALIGAYGFIYYFLNSLSVAGGAEGYPIPKSRVNVVVMGVAKGLSDSIMLCSFDPKENSVDIFSIPRDTYYPRKGVKGTAQMKINASYGSGGADSVVKSVEGLTGVPVHYYVQIDYEAVKSIVNAMGGLKVVVPRDMDYDDPADNLHIHFKKGQVVRKGEDIVRLLRYRKDNKGGGYAEGDLGRIKMQQEIVRLGMQKVMSGNLVANFVRLQGPIKKYVKTNMTPKQMMYYITKARKVNSEAIDIKTLPGKSQTIKGLSFFVVSKNQMQELLSEIREDE